MEKTKNIHKRQICYVSCGMKKIVDFSELSGKLLTVLLSVAVGGWTYYLAATALKVREIGEFISAFRRKS